MQHRPTEEAVVWTCCWQDGATTAAEGLHSCVIVWLYFEWTLFMAVTFLSACGWQKAETPGFWSRRAAPAIVSLLSFYWLSSLPLVCWDFPGQLPQCEFDGIKFFILMGLWFILLSQISAGGGPKSVLRSTAVGCVNTSMLVCQWCGEFCHACLPIDK